MGFPVEVRQSKGESPPEIRQFSQGNPMLNSICFNLIPRGAQGELARNKKALAEDRTNA
jgi:hypothetical protein